VLKSIKVLLGVALVAGLTTLGGCSRQEDSAPPAQPVEAVPPPPAPAPDAGEAIAPDLAALLIRKHSPVLGPANAPVTIVEFLDPACEACAAYAPVVRQIELVYPQEVRVVVRFAAFHPGSDEAIRVLDAARRQGKFEPVLDALFANQEEWASHRAPNVARAWEIAGDAGLNVAKAKRDARDKQAESVLRVEAQDIVALKVERTPTFFVNGRPLMNYGPEPLMNVVSEEVSRAREARN
jgi:protein-disulfide isomerase